MRGVGLDGREVVTCRSETREATGDGDRLALPGQVEQTAGRLIGDMLATEVAAGRLQLPLPPAVCGDAIVRMCDPHLYAHVLGRGEPEIDAALDLVAALLGRVH